MHTNSVACTFIRYYSSFNMFNPCFCYMYMYNTSKLDINPSSGHIILYPLVYVWAMGILNNLMSVVDYNSLSIQNGIACLMIVLYFFVRVTCTVLHYEGVVLRLHST